MGIQCCHFPLNEEETKTILGSLSINKTKLKVKVLQVLSSSSKPLSVQEIYDMTQRMSDLSSVFRTITQFKEKDIVNEVNLHEGFFRYEYIHEGTEKNHHHHYVRCKSCDEIKLIEECDISAFEKAIAKLGFKQVEHRLEFTGLCSKCSRKL